MNELHEPTPDEIGAINELLGSLTTEDRVRVDPSPGLWDRITAELGSELAVEDGGVSAGPPAAASPDASVATSGPSADTAVTARLNPAADSTPVGDSSPVADVVPIGRSRRSPWLLAAAAVLVVAGLVASLAIRNSDSASRIASVAITGDGLADGLARPGEAILERADGRYRLRIDLPEGSQAGDDYLELWMIDTEVKGMVSLGPIEGSETIVLPVGVDPETFPIVDVSREPADGVPTHSGKSILRGQLKVTT